MGVSGCGEVSGRLEGWVGLWWAARLIVPPFVRLTGPAAAKGEVRARTRWRRKTYGKQEPWAGEAEARGLGSAWG